MSSRMARLQRSTFARRRSPRGGEPTNYSGSTSRIWTWPAAKGWCTPRAATPNRCGGPPAAVPRRRSSRPPDARRRRRPGKRSRPAGLPAGRAPVHRGRRPPRPDRRAVDAAPAAALGHRPCGGGRLVDPCSAGEVPARVDSFTGGLHQPQRRRGAGDDRRPRPRESTSTMCGQPGWSLTGDPRRMGSGAVAGGGAAGRADPRRSRCVDGAGAKAPPDVPRRGYAAAFWQPRDGSDGHRATGDPDDPHGGE